MITRRQREILDHLHFREVGETDPSRQQCWLEQNRIGGWDLIVPTLYGAWARSPFSIRKSTLNNLKDMGLISVGKRAEMPKFDGQVWISGHPVSLTQEGRAEIVKGINK